MFIMSKLHFVTKEPINKGWSDDKKYCVTDENGTRFLLRISDMAQYHAKQAEFEMMKQVEALGVPMCEPVEFGTCEEGVYSVQSWIDGVDAEEAVATLSDTEQYAYGLESGRILRRIHTIPAPEVNADGSEAEDCTSLILTAVTTATRGRSSTASSGVHRRLRCLRPVW